MQGYQWDTTLGSRQPKDSTSEWRQLGAYVWTAPSMQGFSEVRRARSGALMCPASHEGGPCQVASRVIVHAQFAKDYIIRPRLSSHHAGFSRANLTSGGIASHHCPASGTRELQEDGTTLCRRRFRTMPDNGDTSLDRSTRTYRLEPTSQKIRTPSSRRHPAVERPVSRIATG